MVGVALVSMFMHFTPFPYLLYLAGGLIFFCIPAQRFSQTHRQLWKWLFIAIVLAVLLIFFSEIAHQLGWLNAEFHLPRKPED
ncbi:putative membrane protein [Acinetobacter baumannii 1437282]|nr:putative membrane protein [Acinetobacter baumannii 1437282]